MELLRVVDKLGNDTNEIIEREELHNRGKLHNEVTIYIINDKGEVLLQRRSKNRRFCPNKLGVIAGHQSYREDILTCAARETKEEVGLKIKKEDLHPLCDKYLVEEKYNNHYMYPYYVICNQKAEDFTIQKEELSFVRWYKIEEVINTTPRLEEFNEDCFKNLIDKIIVGEIDENGNKNPNVNKII